MGKKRVIEELTNLMAIALRHKIGSIVNINEIYAQKYSKDADILIKQVRKISRKDNWNSYDKEKIRKLVEIKLRKELENKDFLDNRKFEIMNEEMNKLLMNLGLD